MCAGGVNGILHSHISKIKAKGHNSLYMYSLTVVCSMCKISGVNSNLCCCFFEGGGIVSFTGGNKASARARKAENRGRILGRASLESPPAKGSGERCKLPQLGPGRKLEIRCNLRPQKSLQKSLIIIIINYCYAEAAQYKNIAISENT